MAAFFDIYASPDPTKGQRRSIHPRLVDSDTLTSSELMSHEQHASTLTEADLSAALIAIRHHILSQLGEGGRVHLDGIGSFSVVPHFVTPKHEGDKVTGKDVTFKRINFQPDPRLCAEIAANLSFQRRTALHSADITLDEAKESLTAYFSDHDDISCRQFESLVHLCDKRARTLLGALLDEGFLSRRKVGNTYLYTKAEA